MEQNLEIPYLGPPSGKFLIYGTIQFDNYFDIDNDTYYVRVGLYSPSTGETTNYTLDEIMSTWSTKINLKIWGPYDSVIQISCRSLKESRSILRTCILINHSSAGKLLDVTKQLIAQHHNLIPIVL